MGVISVAGERVEAAYRQHHQRLWRALLSYCAGDVAVASDAESEAFTQALRRGDAIDDVGAWVWRSAFRIADGMLQRRGRRPRVDVDEIGVDAPLAEFLALLGNLSTQQRQCVVMRYVGGYTPAEIAELLDTSPGTVRVQLHRAHTQLRAELAPEGGRP